MTSVSTWQQIKLGKRTVCSRTKIPILALDGKSVTRIFSLVNKPLGLRTGASCNYGETLEASRGPGEDCHNPWEVSLCPCLPSVETCSLERTHPQEPLSFPFPCRVQPPWPVGDPVAFRIHHWELGLTSGPLGKFLRTGSHHLIYF